MVTHRKEKKKTNELHLRDGLFVLGLNSIWYGRRIKFLLAIFFSYAQQVCMMCIHYAPMRTHFQDIMVSFCVVFSFTGELKYGLKVHQ